MTNWSYIQSFVAVAEHGSLSAAANALGISQPTISRHIARLEQEMGNRLFDRTKSGAALTVPGTDLLRNARKMADAAALLTSDQGDSGAAMKGTVRITASRVVASFTLPKILTKLSQKWPDVEMEVVASDDTHNLLRREADIAVRMYRPTQLDVVTQYLGDLHMAAYATPDYVAKYGRLNTPNELSQHRVVGFERSTLILDRLREMGLTPGPELFQFRSDDQVVCWQMVKAGFGIGFNQAVIGDAEPAVVRVTDRTDLAQLPVWLSTHQEVHQIARIRRVFDFLKAELTKIIRSQT